MMPLPSSHLLFHSNPAWFHLSGAGFLRLSWKRGRWTGVCLTCATALLIAAFHHSWDHKSSQIKRPQWSLVFQQQSAFPDHDSDNGAVSTCSNTTVRLQIHQFSSSWLVAWSSGRTLVFGRRAFAILCSTCSWWVTTYVGKPSAIGQPTRPTQPFILSGSINE